MQRAKQFLEDFTGSGAEAFRPLAQSGSSRRNFLGHSAGRDFIVTYNENLRENRAFFYFSELFSGLGLNTPQIFNISEDQKLYIQEFLGENTLSEILERDGLTPQSKILVEQSLLKLYELQSATFGKTDYGQTFEYERYDELPVTHDLYYFKNFFVDVLEISYHKSALLSEFKKIADLVENLLPQTLMIRDFQARNIMVNGQGEVFFIDYQSAMQGPAMYDVVSFLYQAKANFPPEFREEMLEFYIGLHSSGHVQTALRNSVMPLLLMRYLQVLGAYGFRGIVQKKPHFLASIPRGIQNITNFAEDWQEMYRFPELRQVIGTLTTRNVQNHLENLSK